MSAVVFLCVVGTRVGHSTGETLADIMTAASPNHKANSYGSSAGPNLTTFPNVFVIKIMFNIAYDENHGSRQPCFIGGVAR